MDGRGRHHPARGPAPRRRAQRRDGHGERTQPARPRCPDRAPRRPPPRARQLPRQEPDAPLRRPRPPQPHGDERLLARLSTRRALAQAAPLGLGGVGGGDAGSGPVRRPDPAADPGRSASSRPTAGPPRPRHPRPGAGPRRRPSGPPGRAGAHPRRRPARPDLVAGIGNIFKSEACFAARVDPWRPLADLSDEELRPCSKPPARRCCRRSPAAATPTPSTAPGAPARSAGPHLLPRAGRRQSHDLLVPALPG